MLFQKSGRLSVPLQGAPPPSDPEDRGVSSVWAADEVDDTVKQTLVTTAEGLTDTIIALSDEDIENYTKSSDEFTVGAMTAWAGSKDEVGALKERTAASSERRYVFRFPAV